MTVDWGFGQLMIPQLVRGLSVMLCIVPTVGMALSAFQGQELRYASGLFNLMRNLGGAIGIAVVNTWLQDNTRIEAARMGEALGHTAHAATDTVTQLAQRLAAVTPDPAHALQIARQLIGGIVGQQSLTLAFDDVFRLMTWMFLGALLMVPFCRPSSGSAAAADAH
jgi:DHA2 family multidrug resistance protein